VPVKAGLVATPLNYRHTFREIDHALDISGASAMLAHAERAEDLAASELVPRLPLGAISYGDSEEEEGRAGDASEPRFAELLEAEPATDLLTPGSSDPAAIFFTSGEHRSGQGRHPHARDAALDDGQRDRRLRTDGRHLHPQA
jgi:long-chain acyl-CoA synthetase